MITTLVKMEKCFPISHHASDISGIWTGYNLHHFQAPILKETNRVGVCLWTLQNHLQKM